MRKLNCSNSFKEVENQSADELIKTTNFILNFLSTVNCLSLICLKKLVDIDRSKHRQSSYAGPNLSTDSKPQQMLATFFPHYCSNGYFDISCNSKSTDAYHNLKEKEYTIVFVQEEEQQALVYLATMQPLLLF